MKDEIKAAWIAALRSGEYPQTRQALHDKHGYCCLGVLCELHSKLTGEGAWGPIEIESAEEDDELHAFYVPTDPYDTQDMILPSAVKGWAGVMHDDPYIGDGTLSSINDGDDTEPGKSFAEIADLIERHL